MGLTIRDEKGSALQHAEMDANWRFLRDRIDALEAIYNLAWTTAGVLKPSTVDGSSLKDRIVSQRKRTFPSNFTYNAAGTADALTIANQAGLELVGLAANWGAVFYIKTGALANTGPVTLAVDAEPATAVNKAVGVPLDADDIPANSIIQVYLDVIGGVPTFLLSTGLKGAVGPAGPSGAVTHYFRADKNGANQVFAGGDSSIKVSFGTERFDPGIVYTPGSSTWTCPATGFYAFEAQIRWDVSTAPQINTVAIQCYKNGVPGVGTLVAEHAMQFDAIVSAAKDCMIATGPMAFTLGDILTVYASRTGTLNNTDMIRGELESTWFSGFRIA